jgi:hypothetical protein
MHKELYIRFTMGWYGQVSEIYTKSSSIFTHIRWPKVRTICKISTYRQQELWPENRATRGTLGGL